MTKETAIKLFNEKHIRTQWDDDKEKWYFSIVDVVAVLTESENPNNYWKVLKNRLKKEALIGAKQGWHSFIWIAKIKLLNNHKIIIHGTEN